MRKEEYLIQRWKDIEGRKYLNKKISQFYSKRKCNIAGGYVILINLSNLCLKDLLISFLIFKET